MIFKVGDKVRIIDCPSRSAIGKIGIVADIYLPNSKFSCRVKIGRGWSCPMYEHEIEPLIKVGQQLLFSFMSEVI